MLNRSQGRSGSRDRPLSRIPSLLLVTCIALVLSGCGGGQEASPTPEPSPAPFPTLSPGAVSVGDLLASMESAWATTTSMRTTNWVTTDDTVGTPPGSAAMSIEEVVKPSSRHVVQVVGGTVVDEQIVVDGRIYMKGALVPSAIAPMLDTATWVEVNPETASSGSPIAGLVAYLLAPVTTPVGTVSDETRALEAVPAGTETIGGSSCQVYRFASDSAISYELSIDDRQLPCRLVVSAAGQSSVTLYEFNVPGITIAAPPVATPPAS